MPGFLFAVFSHLREITESSDRNRSLLRNGHGRNWGHQGSRDLMGNSVILSGHAVGSHVS